ncbi:Zonular occludens toxin (Zot) [compost metagenome]
MPSDSKATVTRIPDKPRIEDLVALGKGCEDGGHAESRFGLLVLDECLTWLNSRTWNDKSRLPVLDWFLHARKNRWDIIFLLQNVDACDAQLRDSLCEHFVQCRRLDKLRLFKVIKLPRIHHANVYYGTNSTTGMYVERWVYRGTDLFDAYDTEQTFRDGMEFLPVGTVDMRASYTHLSAWHLKGRYQQPEQPREPMTAKRAALLLLWPLVAGWSLLDPSGFRRIGCRRAHLEHQSQLLQERRASRAEHLRQALDPHAYPSLIP